MPCQYREFLILPRQIRLPALCSLSYSGYLGSVDRFISYLRENYLLESDSKKINLKRQISQLRNSDQDKVSRYKVFMISLHDECQVDARSNGGFTPL